LVATLVAATLVAVVAFAVQGRLSESRVGQPSAPVPSLMSGSPRSEGGSIPDVLRHAWQRPLPVAPGPDVYGSGFLSLTAATAEFGREPGTGALQATIQVAGPDTLTVTATAATQGCETGEVATYRWTIEGSGTAMTLTPLVADACPAREELLAGPWVRADLPTHPGGGSSLAPGTYTTTVFDPFADPARSGRLRYTVPSGWEVKDDQPGAFVLHRVPDSAQGPQSSDVFISVIAQPAMAAEFARGADCSASIDAPGVGGGRDEIVAAIRARPGVVSTPPTERTVGAFSGLMLDLRLAPSWTGGCLSPGGPVVGTQILRAESSGFVVGLGPDAPLRLFLVDLADGHTLAVVIDGIPSSASASPSLEGQASTAMPIVESFVLQRSTS